MNAQWSPDGRKLAYNDLKGLWVWEEERKTDNPRLIVPVEKGNAIVRYFSPHGTYVAITQGDKRYTLKLDTGDIFYDGLFSPTEEYFAAFGTTDPKTQAFPVLICKAGLLDFHDSGCQLDEIGKITNEVEFTPDRFNREELRHIHQIEWVGEYSLRVLVYPQISYDPLGTYWDAKRGYVLRDFVQGELTPLIYPAYEAEQQKDGTYLPTREVVSGFEFVYDHLNRKIALRQNDTTIFIDDKSYDFSKQLSSPIVQIDWLPSLMYRDRSR